MSSRDEQGGRHEARFGVVRSWASGLRLLNKHGSHSSQVHWVGKRISND